MIECEFFTPSHIKGSNQSSIPDHFDECVFGKPVIQNEFSLASKNLQMVNQQ